MGFWQTKVWSTGALVAQALACGGRHDKSWATRSGGILHCVQNDEAILEDDGKKVRATEKLFII